VRLFLLALLFSSTVFGEDHWQILTSGPFEVYTQAGDKPARERLNDLEQFREGFANVIGKTDLKLTWPLRLVIYKKQTPAPAGQIALGRDAYMVALPENAVMPPVMKKQLARLLLDQNTNRLPASIENGLTELFSTLQIAGTRLTLGAPVPQNEQTRDWARMHMLSVSPTYAGRTRILINVLEQSADFTAAYGNAYEKKPAQIEKEVDDYVKAGNYGTTTVSGRAMSARDFHPQDLDSATGRLTHADLLLAFKEYDQAKAEYGSLHGAEAAEGMGLVALAKGNKDEARMMLASAGEGGMKSAQGWLQLALLESDVEKTRMELQRAANANPLWGEPWRQLAKFHPNPTQQVTDLKKATSLEPRNISCWQELAKAATAANDFATAAKAWSGAERAAANDQERQTIRAARLRVEQERADYEEAQRKRAAEEQARELERVKQETMSEIHAAEDAARKKLNPNNEPVPKTAVWIDELNGSAKIDGTLERFDCTGRSSRLVIRTADGKTARLSIRDMSKVGIAGVETMVACGAQKPARRVSVQYIAQPDNKLGTLGEATIIEFH
jgi:hypothetical protein